MSFRWNTFGWINLGIDCLAVILFLGVLFFPSEIRKGKLGALSFLKRQAFSLFGVGVLGLFGASFVGGILGISILARICWTLLTVGLPISLIWQWKISRQFVWLFPMFVLVGFKFYGEIWETDRLEVDRRQIAIAGIKTPFRVTHLSDLQTDDLRGLHERVLDESNSFNPDFVLMTGDLMNHTKLYADIADYLSQFKSQYGTYLVGGDVDQGIDLDAFSELAKVTNLDKRAMTFDMGAQRIKLLGLGLMDYEDESLLGDLIEKSEPSQVQILMAHRPDALFMAEKFPIDAFFTGHTHGGQICAPWGPLLTLTNVDSTIAAGGVHRVKNLWVVLSRGLGGEGHFAPRIRLFCRPHILLVEFVPQ